MKVFKGIKSISADFKEVITTLGVYDGVHLGHQEIIKKTVLAAKKYNHPSMLITFNPHPRTVLSKTSADFLPILTSPEEKNSYLKTTGLDSVLILETTRELLNIEADDFIKQILLKGISAKKVIVGYNYHFGKNRTGTPEFLEKSGSKYDLKTMIIPAFSINKQVVSSSRIRDYLKNGKIEEANQLLGRPYSMFGKIIKGTGTGRKLGFPTANIDIENSYKLIPENGVYITKTFLNGKPYFGICNIGFRPTFNGTFRTIEIHIISPPELDLYGETVKVEFLEKLRDEKKFSHIDELKVQISKDKQNCIEKLNHIF